MEQNQDLAAIHQRLNEGDIRMEKLEGAVKENTTLTRQIADNTAGFVNFQNDLESGARFFCRLVKGIQFILKDVVEPYWKPALVVFCALYLLTHDGALPRWVSGIVGALLGM